MKLIHLLYAFALLIITTAYWLQSFFNNKK